MLPRPEDVLASATGEKRTGRKTATAAPSLPGFHKAKSSVQRMRLNAAGEDADTVFAREDIKTISTNIVNGERARMRARRRRTDA
jgi:hypothetical protein